MDKKTTRDTPRITPKKRADMLYYFECQFSSSSVSQSTPSCSPHMPRFPNLWGKQRKKDLQWKLKKAEEAYRCFQNNAGDYNVFHDRELNMVLSKRMDALLQKIKKLDEHHQKNIEALKAEIATCTFSEEQCASELENYRKLLQQDREMSCMIPKYQSRDAVRSAYRREELSQNDASMMLRNILIRKAIENAEWYCPGQLFQIAQQDLLSY
jgi:hypothetical protein